MAEEASSSEEYGRDAFEAQRAKLRAEIRKRITDADRGQIAPLDVERIKTEGQQRLELG